MDESPGQVRSQAPAVMGAIILASVAVTGFAAVAIAYMLGWVGERETLPAAPASIATPGQQVAGTAPDVISEVAYPVRVRDTLEWGAGKRMEFDQQFER